jgi:hypothetical protein
MRAVFELARGFGDMPVTEIEKLLESPTRKARIGALSVMDKQARHKRTGERRAEPFRL